MGEIWDLNLTHVDLVKPRVESVDYWTETNWESKTAEESSKSWDISRKRNEVFCELVLLQHLVNRVYWVKTGGEVTKHTLEETLLVVELPILSQECFARDSEWKYRLRKNSRRSFIYQFSKKSSHRDESNQEEEGGWHRLSIWIEIQMEVVADDRFEEVERFEWKDSHNSLLK